MHSIFSRSGAKSRLKSVHPPPQSLEHQTQPQAPEQVSLNFYIQNQMDNNPTTSLPSRLPSLPQDDARFADVAVERDVDEFERTRQPRLRTTMLPNSSMLARISDVHIRAVRGVGEDRFSRGEGRRRRKRGRRRHRKVSLSREEEQGCLVNREWSYRRCIFKSQIGKQESKATDEILAAGTDDHFLPTS